MKTLLFLRHGKSDWDADYGHDHERPLKKRGRKAARAVGRFLTETDQAPNSVVTSTAVRARETLTSALEAGGWACPVRATETLYEATPADVRREIQAEPDGAERLLLVGHEPTWSETIGRLIGASPGDAARVRFPTAALARVDVDVARWAEVDFGWGELIWLLPPRLLAR